MSESVRGLSYPAVAATLEMLNVKRKERKAMFDAMRVMEQAALEVLREKADD